MSLTNTVSNVNADTALKLVTSAVEKARELGVEITVCVVDSYGFTMAQLCTDNARFQTKDFAYNKAYTAAAMRSDTTEWYNKVKSNEQVLQGLTNRESRFMLFPGGIPLTHKGDFIGAIGISGGSAEEDIAIANHALSASGL